MPSNLIVLVAAVAGMVTTGTAAAAADPGSTTDARPIRLDVQEMPGRVVLKVVGASDSPVDARYTLKVAAHGQGGVNETSQGGAVRLTPGREVTVIDLSVASGRDASWTATLQVERSSGPAYEIRRQSGNAGT